MAVIDTNALYRLPSRRPWLRPGVVLVGAVLLLAVFGTVLWAHQQRLVRASQLEQDRRQRIAATPPVSKGAEELRKAAQIVDRANAFPWATVFEAISGTGANTVVLAEFSVDPSRGIVSLRGKAKDRAALLAMIERVRSVEGIRAVSLQRERLADVQRGDVVNFEVTARLPM